MAKTVIASFDSFSEAQQLLSVLQREGFPSSDVSLVGNDSRGEYGGSVEGSVEGSDSGVGAVDVPPGSRSEDMRSATPVERATGALSQDAPASLSDTGKGAAAGAATGGVLGGAAGLAVALLGLTIPGIGPIVAAGPLAAALAGAGIGAVAGGLLGGLTSVGVPEQEAHLYAEAVRRGGALVLVRADDDAEALRAAALMREHGAVDIDNRAEQWRGEGWSTHTLESDPYSAEDIERERSRYAHHGSHTSASPVGNASANAVGADAGMTAPLGGASLGVGAVTQAASPREEIEADRQMLDSTRGARAGSSMGSGAGNSVGSTLMSPSALTSPRLDDPYRQHYNEHFNLGGGEGGVEGGGEGGDAGFEHFEPAYRYGEDLQGESRYDGRSWDEIEPYARDDWERRYPDQAGSGWERVKSAVRHGWERTKDTVERVIPGDSDRDGR